MFIFNLVCPEIRGNHSLTSKCRFKNPDFVTSWSSKPVPLEFLFPLFLANLDKKYSNEIEMDKK